MLFVTNSSIATSNFSWLYFTQHYKASLVSLFCATVNWINFTVNCAFSFRLRIWLHIYLLVYYFTSLIIWCKVSYFICLLYILHSLLLLADFPSSLLSVFYMQLKIITILSISSLRCDMVPEDRNLNIILRMDEQKHLLGSGSREATI